MEKQKLIDEVMELFAKNDLLVERNYIENQVNDGLDDGEIALCMRSHHGVCNEEISDCLCDEIIRAKTLEIKFNIEYMNKRKEEIKNKGKDEKTVADLMFELQGNRIVYKEIFNYVIETLNKVKPDRDWSKCDYELDEETLTDDVYNTIFNILDR